MKLIKNGTVMTMGPQGTLRADVLIEDGKIVRIAENITAEQAEVEEVKESYFYEYRKFDGKGRFDGTHTFDECVATYSYEIS